jgi:hypothetical protein
MIRPRAIAGKVRGMRRWLTLAAVVLSPTVALPAAAKVQQVNERGFVILFAATVPAAGDKVWDELLNPADWWDSDHTYSGDAANLSLDAKPGGCFCETLPGENGGPPRGGIEHMRVVQIEKPRWLRMNGALGPLENDALVGTLTFQLKPGPDGGTQIIVEYVVGGFFRKPVEGVSASVDTVLGQQLERLATKLGAKPKPTEAPAETPAKEPEKPADDTGQGKSEIIGR